LRAEIAKIFDQENPVIERSERKRKGTSQGITGSEINGGRRRWVIECSKKKTGRENLPSVRNGYVAGGAWREEFVKGDLQEKVKGYGKGSL